MSIWTNKTKEPDLRALVPKEKAVHPSVHGFFFVSYTGFEPVTSALSRQRSEPTELIALKRVVNVHNETVTYNFM